MALSARLVDVAIGAGDLTVSTAGVSANELLVAFVDTDAGGGPPTPGGGWTVRATGDGDSGSDITWALVRDHVGPGGASHTFNISPGADGAAILVAITATAGSPQWDDGDAAGVGPGVSADMAAPSVPAAGPTSLLLCFWMLFNGTDPASITPPGGMTQLVDNLDSHSWGLRSIYAQPVGAGATGSRTATASAAAYGHVSTALTFTEVRAGAPTIVDFASGHQEGGPVPLAVTADVGDTLVAIYATDYYGAPDVSDLTGGHTWSQRTVDPNGAPAPHVGFFTAPVTTGGVQDVTFAANADATTFGFLYAVANVATVDDAAAGGAQTNATSHIVPSMAAATAQALMITAAVGGGQAQDQSGDYIWPAAMNERAEQDSPPWSSASTADQPLSATGATGTRTATYSVATWWAAGGIVLSGTAGPAPVELAGTIDAAAQVSGELFVTGATEFGGITDAAAQVTGQLQVQRSLGGTVDAAARLDGDLQVGGPVELAGTIDAAAQLSGQMQITAAAGGGGGTLEQPLPARPAHPELDLAPWVGQRQATFRFILIDGPTGIHKGEIHPIRDSVPQLQHSTGRTITRTLSLDLDAEATAKVNTIRDRVRVQMLIGDDVWPLGTYLFVSNPRAVLSPGVRASAPALMDHMWAVDQQLTTSFATTAPETAEEALRRLLTPFTVETRFEPSQFSATGAWAPGTQRGKVVEFLALTGDWFAPWFDNHDVLRFVRAFDPTSRSPRFDYDRHQVVYRDGITEVDDLLEAPNRWIVVSNLSDQETSMATPIVGVYDLPDEAPQSAANRGFSIPQQVEMPVASALHAAAIARNLGQRQTLYEQVELSTPPDPRHDAYDVVRWDGRRWLEIGWSMQLIAGGDMRHTLRRAYVGRYEQ